MKTNRVEYWTSRSPKKWRLIAHNDTGASLEFWGKTKKEAIALFDQEYDRKGFKFTIIHYKN